MTNKSKLLICGSTLILSMGATTLSQAQESVDEIIVTARKVSESLQEIPVSVAAFSSASIEERGIEDLTEIARATPNFSFENFNGGFSTPVIRGQSQNRLTNPVQNVATFYNGIYLPRGYMIDSSLLNIGQVEVLRGPQSASLGRSAYAGAVNFQTKKPGEEFTAFGSASIGENEYRRFDATAEIPIVGDRLGLIAGFSHGEYDGGWKNNHPQADTNNPIARTTGNLGGYEYDTFQVGLNLAPEDSFSFNVNYVNNERDVENTAQYVVDNRFGNNCSTFPATPAFGFFPAAPARNALYCGEFPAEVELGTGETRGEGLIIDPRAGITLKSEIFNIEGSFDISETVSLDVLYGHTTGSFEGSNSSSRDLETGFGSGFFATNFFDTNGNGSVVADSIEGRLNFTPSENLTTFAGVHYSKTDDLSKSELLQAPGDFVGTFPFLSPVPRALTAPLVPLTGTGQSVVDSVNARKITSVFGFAEYEADQFALSVEGRYTWEDVTDINNIAGTNVSDDFNYFTPRITGTYFINDNQNIYASYAKGVKAGGINVGASDPSTFGDLSQLAYDTESNDTFEIGSRNKLLGGALTLNGTAFYIDAKDLQINTPKTLPPGDMGLPPNIVGNIASTSTYGVELDVDYSVNDNLDLYGGLGYVKGEYGDDIIDPALVSECRIPAVPGNVPVCDGNIGGNQIERAPSLTINAGFAWEDALTTSLDYYVRGNVGYQDDSYATALNLASYPSRTIVDGSIGITSGPLDFKINVDNLFDKKYASSGFYLSSFFERHVPNLGPRRRISGTISYRFD